MTADLYCVDCDVTGPHVLEGREAVCCACGCAREVEADVLAVIDVAFCAWCQSTLPVGHACRPDPTPCKSRTRLGTCGQCGVCTAAQQADPRYGGSPSDIDAPWSSA